MQILKKLGLLAIAFVLIAPFSMQLPAPAHAATLSENLDSSSGGLANASLPELIGTLINVLISVLGIILLLLIIYAGFLWMTAGGKEDQVKTAKTILINAVVGMIILLAAYAIANFVIDALVTGGIAE